MRDLMSTAVAVLACKVYLASSWALATLPNTVAGVSTGPGQEHEIIGDEKIVPVHYEANTQGLPIENLRPDDEDDHDPVVEWLDTLNTPLPDGSILTSSLFNSLITSTISTTFTPTTDFHTHSPQTPSPSCHTEPGKVQATSAAEARTYYETDSQKPLGFIAQAWKCTKECTSMTLKSISQYFCGHGTAQNGHPHVRPDQAPLDSGNDQTGHYNHAPLPSRPALGHKSSFGASLIPTATAALSGATKIATSRLDSSDRVADGLFSSSSSRHDHLYILAALVSILVTLIVSSLIFCYVTYRNPRRRAERLARLEEIRNKRAYRKAAFRHRLRGWRQATFGRIWAIGAIFTTSNTIDPNLEKLTGPLLSSGSGPSDDPIFREVQSFRDVHEQLTSLLQAEEGVRPSFIKRKQHPADRNRRRTYLWLFGGRRNRPRNGRPRAGSSSDSDAASIRSFSDKSAGTGVTPPPPYEERQIYAQVDDRYLMKIITNGKDESDRSSVSSLVPTSPVEGSMTLGTIEVASEKDI